ncbi:hypothetical protein BVRB_4g096960 isoform A [Beta vulgaris subsp. vulgaris]|uniref:DUF1771 domain-containing protein n=2 Tax=Beta vulgaris subsp. vulgaris TaxID=3555 RepID=A0A0J8BD32_BETVV|nr:hypothetical protein BVRB_4g096960 isoform A [Beta vulgaris subsp. vulgaris]
MDMELLLEAFGSSFSLETISSAYSQASRNVELAGVILYELQGTTAVSYESKDGMDAASTSSSNLISDGISKYQYIAEESISGLSVNNAISGISGGQHLKSTNASSKIHSFDMHSNKSLAASHSNTGKDDNMHGMDAASTSSSNLISDGTSKYQYIAEESVTGLSVNNDISGISGGQYLKSTNASSKIHSFDMHPNKSLAASHSNTGKDDSMHADIEDFLFQMLGDGFQLDMKMIHEVLGLCGYDLEKSMETLVDLSASTLEKSDDVVSKSAEKEMYLKIGSFSEKSQSGSSLSNNRLAKQKGKESRKKNNGKYDLQQEILGALFAAPERVEELPKKTSARTRGPRTYGRTAVEVSKETEIEQSFVTVKPLAGRSEVEDKEDENSFPVLRQAVKEHWSTMKEYYKAATDAFTEGDQVRAYKLMEKGQFFNRKAREADEKSGQKLLERRDEEMLLDISTLEPREAIKLLKLHLSNLAGISTIRYLKITVGDDSGENKKVCLKRLVLKLLERESIGWTEAENGKTIVMQLDEINPKSLSFTKK